MSAGLAEMPALPSRTPPPAPMTQDRMPRVTGPLLLALLVAVLWHAFWIVGFRGRSQPARPTIRPLPSLRLAAVPAEADGVAADPRVVWSPVMFSLPTPFGFSRPILETRMDVRPVSGLLEAEPRLLERPPEASAMSAGRDPQLEDILMAYLFRVSLPPLEAQVFQAGSLPASSKVELMPEWSGAVFTAMPLPENWETAGDHPWELTAHLEVDESGRVGHVFLVHPCEYPKINLSVERALRNWQMAPGSAARSGRVLIRAAGPAAASPEAKRDVP